MAVALAQLPAKTSHCLVLPPQQSPLQGPLLCSVATLQVAGLPPVIRNHQGSTSTPLTPHPGPFDRARGRGRGTAASATGFSAACEGLLQAPGAWPRACSLPARGWGFHSEPLHLEAII